ncbi:O-glucosyltransferase rumi-like [Drosophila kikkawai]|uniref:O-glucosyltransferase rumi-like n=1 Tax=Drosophila kikkawai TaxID=30033 RepID=A0A6P4J2E2_DROKI|nr:O-glucosyltransferase rumi-like [Drosophila kikkawai]
MTTLQGRLLFVAALLMCCAWQTLSAVEDKCSALSQYHDPKFSYDFVPYIYRPCEPGDLQCLCHVQAIRKNLEPYKGNGIIVDMMILQYYPHGLGRCIPWSAKRSKGFYRGLRSSPERDNLVMVPCTSPDLVDSQYPLHVAGESGSPTHEVDLSEEMPFFEHRQYKYLFNFHGVLLCRSLVIHLGDQWQELFYNQLIPWVHYVSVASDAGVEELADLMLYLREEIDEKGHEFVWLYLRMNDVQCYCWKLLQEYVKLLTYQVHQKRDFVEVSNKRAVQVHRG